MRQGTDIEIILDHAVVEVLFTEYAADSREAAETGRFHVRAFDRCPFELLLCDETVAITVHDDGFLPGLAEPDDPGVLVWAASIDDEYADRAEYVTLI